MRHGPEDCWTEPIGVLNHLRWANIDPLIQIMNPIVPLFRVPIDVVNALTVSKITAQHGIPGRMKMLEPFMQLGTGPLTVVAGHSKAAA